MMNLVQDEDPITYHVHKFILCGRMLSIASVHVLMEDISQQDAFEYIASDKAKDAAER
jgi:hypothetical protein